MSQYSRAAYQTRTGRLRAKRGLLEEAAREYTRTLREGLQREHERALSMLELAAKEFTEAEQTRRSQ